MDEDFFEDDTHVTNCLNLKRIEIEIAILSLNEEMDENIYYTNDIAYDSEMKILSGYFSVHLTVNVDHYRRKFFMKIGAVK